VVEPFEAVVVGLHGLVLVGLGVLCEFDGALDLGLAPEEGHAAADTEVDVEHVVAFDDFLGLHEVGGVACFVQPAAVEASA